MKNNFIKLGAVILTMVSSVLAGSTVIPSDLQWPLKNKGVADTSIFFDTEDAVDTPKGDARNCDANGNRGGSKTHFDRHAGHDIIASVGTKVYPVYEGYIVAIGSSVIYKGASWKNFMVVEHNNNGKLWTSVYWHLQNKGLVNTKKSDCNLRKTGNTNLECKVTKNTILSYVEDTTDMNDVNHLHLGIRPKPYLKGISQLGFAIGKKLNNFENPLDYLPHPYYYLRDDEKGSYRASWKKSNTLDMYSGIGYKETSAYWNDSAALLFHNKSINHTGRYKVYAKFPVSSNRSQKAYYLMYVNRKLVGGKKINQSDSKNRGHNVLFFDGTFKKGDDIIIILANGNKGNYMSSDAILFVRQ